MKYFLATYTHICKSYCDLQFFNRLLQITPDVIHVIDNSPAETNYTARLQSISDNLDVQHLAVDPEPSQTRFQRAVADSANALRDQFLKTNLPYFFVIESDVLPPANVLALFDKAIASLPENWGVLGGLYYIGFHDYSLRGLQPTHHVLSGCTIYRREVIEKFPFRWDINKLGAFPDAWISDDVNLDGNFTLFNDHDIICGHLHNTNGTRYS